MGFGPSLDAIDYDRTRVPPTTARGPVTVYTDFRISTSEFSDITRASVLLPPVHVNKLVAFPSYFVECSPYFNIYRLYTI